MVGRSFLGGLQDIGVSKGSMILLHAVAVCLLHLIPKHILQRALVRQLSVAAYVFQPCFSGRSALFSLAVHLRPRNVKPVVLVPDYVCNIVPKAFILAGYEIVTYRTDKYLEPSWEDLVALLHQTNAHVLVGASVFGSSGLLCELENPRKLAFLRSRGVHVVLDLAQDVRLRTRLPLLGHDFVHAILSFNDKSFPGAMGGGILSAHDVPRAGEERPTFRRRLVLYRILCRKYVAGFLGVFRSKRALRGLDYAACEKYPYQIERGLLPPQKLQIILGLVGLKLIRRLDARKQRLLRENLHMPTMFASSAAFLLMGNPLFGKQSSVASRRRRKMPYALQDNPARGLRMNDFIVHNKGFFDR